VFRRLFALVLVAGGIAIAVFAGWGGLAVYAFFVLLAGAIAYAAGVGGEWLESASRSRFDRHD
jgi:hypothetical protein